MPDTLTDEELFCLEGCRSYRQYYNMRKGFEEEECAFCNLDRELNKIFWEDDLAMAWHVPEAYMRKELAIHVLIVPKRHVRFEADLSDAEALSIHKAKQCVPGVFGYTGGLSHVREGDMSLNAGTVPHLHYNIFQPNMTGEVRVPVFKDPSDRKKNQEKAAHFSWMYKDGMVPK